MRVCTDGIEVYAIDNPEVEHVDWVALAEAIWADNRKPLPHSPKVHALAVALVELKEMVANREQ